MNDTTITTGLERTAAVCRRIEAERLNECATDRFEGSGWERSVTLDCGCHVHIKRCDDGMESWWTERVWSLCDKHEAMGVEP